MDALEVGNRQGRRLPETPEGAFPRHAASIFFLELAGPYLTILRFRSLPQGNGVKMWEVRLERLSIPDETRCTSSD
jgi:hypothetical protein